MRAPSGDASPIMRPIIRKRFKKRARMGWRAASYVIPRGSTTGWGRKEIRSARSIKRAEPARLALNLLKPPPPIR